MSRREAIKAVVLDMVEEVTGEPREVGGGDLLVDQLGLRSLHLARITAILEVELGLDPFSELVPITGIRTLDDLYRAYDLAAGDIAPSAAAPVSDAPEPAPTGRAAALRARELRTRARDEA
ncbi:hypothetical protein [Streptomyces sp. NBC_01092]|uniref:hypothetical protein n=1 Tax=Streptomyces sp. NBC_01092 TaxID=2903748 RepID=UPI00386A1747|nr:hypothetical protein OG254_09935 [Streptomyces sp. NBC_01092]